MKLWRSDPSRGTNPAEVNPQPRVLLIHPDQAGREYTSKLLENLGTAVTACSSFEDGINFLDAERWDFIAINQGGATFPGRIILERASEIDRRLPVLVLTRYHEMSCYTDAMQLGAVDYLEEPVSPPELARVVRTHVKSVPNHDRRKKPRGATLRRLRTSPLSQGA
jgi:DNA-binding NtrC family response regulator